MHCLLVLRVPVTCVPPDPGIQSAALGTGEAAALGASVSVAPGAGETAALGARESAASSACESTPSGTTSTEALHTFTLDSGASRCFFRDRTALEQLARPVAVSLADPSGGPDEGVHQFTPAYERVTHCTCARTGRHLATFTRQPGSDLDTLTTASPQVAASASASGQLSAPCSCCSLAHETVLWHHRLGHPSVQRLRGMHSRYLVSGLPRVLPPLPPSPAPSCLPCVEGRQRAAPHSSSFPPTTAPLQTLHMDVWGPARVRGQGHERYFLIVADDYSRYTTVFPLRTKGEVPDVLIPWIRAARLQLSERFHSDFPVLRLHFDRGGEFSSDLLRAFCEGEGIEQSFTLPASPQHNGVAERRIGLVMEVARTSLIHAAAPHFLWPFAVRYAAHQLNLWPRVSLPETSPTLLWTGKVGDASRFRVWGSRAFVRDTSANKLSSRAIPCAAVVDPLPPQGAAPSGVSQVDPVEPVEVAVDSRPARGAEPGGEEPGGAEPERVEPGGAEPAGTEPGGAEPGGAEPEVVESGGAEPESATSEGTEPGGAATDRAAPGGAPSSQQLREWYSRYCSLRRGASGARGAAGAGARGSPPRREPPSPQRPREWYARRCSLRSGATGALGPGAGAAGGGVAGGTAGAGAAGGAAGAGATGGASGTGGAAYSAGGAAGAGAAGGAAGAGATGGAAGAAGGATGAGATRGPAGAGAAGAAGSEGARTGGTGAAGTGAAAGVGVGGTGAAGVTGGAAGVVAGDPGAEGAGAVSAVDFAAACRLDYAASLVAESESIYPPSFGGECALGTDVLEDMQEEFECFAAALPHLVSMLIAPEGDPDAPDIPTPSSYAKAMEGPYSSQWQTAMDAEMASWNSIGTYVDKVPPLGTNIVSGMWIFRVKQPPGSPPVFKARYVARGFSQREGVDFFQTFSPTPKMTRPLFGLHEEIWLRRPPGFTGSFPPGTQWSLRRPVYGLRQAPREWHNTLRTTLAALGFAPSTAHPSLFLRTDTTLPLFCVLVYVDDLVFATTDTEELAHVKSELQKRHTCTDLGEVTSYLGLRITRDRAQRTTTLTPSHMVQQVLQRFRFTYSSPQATPLPTGHSLSALPFDESVEPSGPYPELVGCLMYLMTCTRPDLAYPLSILASYVAPGRHRKEHMDAAKRVFRYLCSTSSMGLVLGGRTRVVLTGHSDASWVDDQATQRSSQGYTFSLGSGSVSWCSTRSSSVLSSSCEAEIYATAMAAQELRWLTYLLTDLGEPPRSPPVLYVDNKATIALCQEHRLEHRTKHIALRYFLARELQQRGQLRLAYVATRAKTADVFTKALQPCDHQRFCTVLGLVPTVPHFLTS
ncbi:unnamed protein product [Closterium sp. NIES-64]|nr:unnamed protein product [Closterium sp. NIES-64]